MPGFTAVAALTLAIGIGANTAIFSVIESLLLKPLPYPRSEELVVLDHAAPGVNLTSADAAPFQYFVYREEGRVFQDVGLWNTGTVSVTGLAEPEEVRTLFVTDGILPMLGAQPMVGRVFTRADDTPATPETVVLTAGYWRAKLGGDRAAAIGRMLTDDSHDSRAEQRPSGVRPAGRGADVPPVHSRIAGQGTSRRRKPSPACRPWRSRRP
jgi:MacB-like periplasmic core domain